MIQLTDAITLFKNKDVAKGVVLNTGKEVQIIIGKRKFTGTICGLDCIIKEPSRHDMQPFIDINLSLVNVTVLSCEEPL